jgi:hypothetical protein
LLQIVPLARAALQLPLPRVQDDDTDGLAGVGEPIWLNSHCTATAELGGAVEAAAGHFTAVALALAPAAGTRAAPPASAATTITPIDRRASTRAR